MVADRPHARIAADLVIDQRIGARASDYAADETTRFLLGPRYALLRPSFADGRRRRPPRNAPPHVLIMMGGSDPRGATFEVLEAIDSLPAHFAVDVVAGVAQRRLPRLAAAVGAARHPARLHHDPKDVASVMARATVAVSAAGGTCWELACLGVPTLILVAADNQGPNAAGLAHSGFALSLGSIAPFPGRRVRSSVATLLGDRRRLRRMSAAGRRLVDGRGAQRAARAVLGLIR
jgi:spore coat polysaccharide biosynthesis predicted glycosyltransferase SpsG